MRFSRFFILFLLVVWPATAAENPLQVSVEGKAEVITLSLPAKGAYKVFTLEAPDRLVIDVPALQPPVKAALPEDFKGGLIQAVRYGQFDPTTSRFVFELAGPVRIQETREEDETPFKLVVSIAGTGEQKATQAAKTAKKKEEAPAPKKPEKPVIVIDAGHGGVDPGTIGVDGIYEKEITLAYAQALQETLLRTGRYKVMLTREGDQFILLRKRVQMAREAGGSLFISIHADSAPVKQARGISVYTLSEKASDKEAEALAERENKADIIANIDLSGESEDVAGILISLAQRETKNQSAMLADLLVVNFAPGVPVLPNTHRFAGFAVLKAPDIPSVLIELGFLSNRKEAKLLKDAKHRDKVTRSIVKGVDAYFAKTRKGN